jgi:hypothetical protein
MKRKGWLVRQAIQKYLLEQIDLTGYQDENGNDYVMESMSDDEKLAAARRIFESEMGRETKSLCRLAGWTMQHCINRIHLLRHNQTGSRNWWAKRKLNGERRRPHL